MQNIMIIHLKTWNKTKRSAVSEKVSGSVNDGHTPIICREAKLLKK